MKKIFGLLAAMVFAGVGAAEYMVVAKEMAYESDDWACSVPAGILVSKKGSVVASGTYALPKAGKYTVWVLTETRNEGWRKATIKINGAPFGKFGDEKRKDYTKPTGYWKKMMLPYTAKADNEVIKVEIVDAGKGSVRFGGVIFSDNPEFDPAKVDGPVADAVEVLENAE